jgi:hypothetical protein
MFGGNKKVVEVVIKAKDGTGKAVASAGRGLGKFVKQNIASIAVFSSVGAAATAATTAIVAGMKKAVTAAAALVNEMANLGDTFDKMSLRTNVNADELAGWGFILERAGAQTADLETAVRRMSKSMFDYGRNLSTAVVAWDALGVAPMNAAGQLKGVNEILLEMADAFPRIANDAERMAIAQELLGRGGLKMAAAFASGSDEIERQLQLYQDLNAEMSIEFTKGAAAVIDAQTDMQWAIRGLKADLLEPIQPIIAEVIDEMALAVGRFGKYIEENQEAVREFAEAVGDISMSFVRAGNAIGEFATGPGPKLIKLLVALDPGLRAASNRLRLFRLGMGFLADAADDGVTAINALKDSITDWEPPDMFGPEGTIAKQVEEYRDEALALLAADYNIPVLKLNISESGQVEYIGKTPEELATEVVAAIDAEIAKAELPAPDLGVFKQEGIDESIQKMGEYGDAVRAADAEFDAMIDSLMDIDVTATFPNEEQIEYMEEYERHMQTMAELNSIMAGNMQRLASDSIKAFLSGNITAKSFAATLQSVVVDAISAVIAKLLTLQAIKLFSGPLGFLFGGGGTVSGTKHGGTIPGAAHGYTVPTAGGRPGMDSQLIMAQPGEHVFDLELSRRMERFLAAQESVSAISPFGINAGGDRGELHLHMDVARPVGRLDAMSLGEDMVAVAELIQEADL